MLMDARNYHRKTMKNTFPGWELKLLTKPRVNRKPSNANIRTEDKDDKNIKNNHHRQSDSKKNKLHVSNNLLPSPK